MVNYFELKNNASSTLASGVTDTATTITVASGEGVKFPATGVFPLTIWDDSNHPDPGDDGDHEIVWGTNTTGDVITITRAKESTSGFAHLTGARVSQLITVGIFDDPTYGIKQGSGAVRVWLAAAAADMPQSDFSLTGTVTMTNASTAVTGSGTAFDTELKVGDYIKLDTDSSVFWAKISAITSAVALTIDANYGGTGGSSAGSGSGRPSGYSYVFGTGESIGYGQLEFDDTARERAGWRIPLPDVATTIALKIHWKQASVGTGNVVFKLGIKGVNEWENITTLVMPTLSDTIIDAALNNVTHLTIAIDSSVASNATDDEMGIFLIEVDAPNASHTLVGDVNVFGILAEYTSI